MSIYILLSANLSLASTITVGSNGISTIQSAIDSASSNDTISSPSGTYSECLSLDATLQNISFVGSGTVSIDGTGCSANAGVIIDGSSAVFDEIDFENSGGRVFWVNNGSLALNNTTINDAGSSSLDGGVIYLSVGTVMISGGTFSGNSGDKGGVIYAENGTISIANASLDSNEGEYGGVIYMRYSSLDSQNNTYEENLGRIK